MTLSSHRIASATADDLVWIAGLGEDLVLEFFSAPEDVDSQQPFVVSAAAAYRLRAIICDVARRARDLEAGR